VAGIPGRGGQNRLSLEELEARNTFRPARHRYLIDGGPPPVRADGRPRPDQPVPAALRRVAVRGLTGQARTVEQETLAAYGDWTRPLIETLRLYALSAARLADLSQPSDAAERRRELRTYLALLKALDLERP